jgi:hypothetical protein
VGLNSLKSLNLTNGYPNKNKKNKKNKNNKVKSKPLELRSRVKIPDQIDIKKFRYAFVWRNWLHFDMKILEFLKSIWYQFLQTNAYQNILIAALNSRILTNISKQVTMAAWYSGKSLLLEHKFLTLY